MQKEIGHGVIFMTKSVELKYYEQKDVWKNYNNNVGEIRRAENVVRLIPEDVKSV